MEWQSVVSSLIGSSPATALCVLAIRALWKRLEERDAELAAANRARVEDLRAILELSNSGAESRPRA